MRLADSLNRATKMLVTCRRWNIVFEHVLDDGVNMTRRILQLVEKYSQRIKWNNEFGIRRS